MSHDHREWIVVSPHHSQSETLNYAIVKQDISQAKNPSPKINRKLLATVFFNCYRVVYYVFMVKRRAITKDRYFKTLQNLKNKPFYASQCGKLSDDIILLHDNIRFHETHETQTLLINSYRSFTSVTIQPWFNVIWFSFVYTN